jgi:hypothetical protein
MAYEAKKLVAKLKAKGLDIAEDAAQLVVDSVCEFLVEGAQESESKLDDLVVPPAIAVLKPLADAQIDKIDGHEG